MSVYRRLKIGIPMHAFAIFGRIPHYRRWTQMLPSLLKFSANEAAQERLKMIQLYDELGEAGSIRYNRANRKTIHVWKRKLARSGNRLESLIPQSTRPKHPRRMQTDPRVVAFLRQLREAHPHLGKEKLKPLLDAYCR